jgi:phosphohistidine swiveling domain-containing protein
MAKLVGYPSASEGLLTDVDSAARNPVGTEMKDETGATYVYLQGLASVAAGEFVTYANGAVIARAKDTPTVGSVAVAMAAIVASKYGWFQVTGTVLVAAIATDSGADGKILVASSTDGRASTTAAAGKTIFGAFAVGAAASNAGKAQLNRPFIIGTTTL